MGTNRAILEMLSLSEACLAAAGPSQGNSGELADKVQTLFSCIADREGLCEMTDALELVLDNMEELLFSGAAQSLKSDYELPYMLFLAECCMIDIDHRYGYLFLQNKLEGFYSELKAKNFNPRKSKNAELQCFLFKLAELESPAYKKRLRHDYVKRLLPFAYRQAKGACVEKKAVFLQPRAGLNQTFKYIYGYLKEQGEYKLVLHELFRDEVPQSLYYWNALRFVTDAATARVVFVHESNELMGHISVRDESKVVQLWHGCGVLKQIGLDTAGKPGYKTVAGYREFPEYNYYSCVTVASPEVSWVFERFMGIEKESGIIKPLGVSRTDVFFDQGYIERCYAKLYDRLPEAREKKVALYAPTYRGVGSKRIAPRELDIEMMAESLSDDYILIVKHHQTSKDIPPIPEACRNSFAYDMTRGCGMDISELLTVADVCISDYSSVVFEFSLFERPIAFFVYDLDRYIDNRGLYYDFDKVTPGPLCKTTAEIVDYLLSLKDGFDAAEVKAFKEKFMGSCDGRATERIMKYVEDGIAEAECDGKSESAKSRFLYRRVGSVARGAIKRLMG